ncbi:M12 family metallopeptidase [Aquimarina sp. RZ0]|uniref:M12 family metallopeptidase n=1 Tax=Aquimarina sp. RZ0 TaxID=2607730 RepID=UPI00165F93E2|nr:M12 family metallopeptidase [Aquimarina sp. RZ0]
MKIKSFLSIGVFCASLFFFSCEKDELTSPNVETIAQEEGNPLFAEGGTLETISYYGEQITAQKIDGQYIIGGDMIVTPDEADPNAKGFATTRNKLWSSNTIPFTVDKRFKNTKAIYNAIKHIEQKSNLKFKWRTNEKKYIKINYNTSGCTANVGTTGGVTNVNLTESCASQAQHGTALHEIMHALGFWHEHTRSDRDKYININIKNVPSGFIGLLNKLPSNQTTLATKSLDFQSIMIYGSNRITRNGKPTMTRKNGSTWPQPTTNRNWLSQGDINALNKLYPKKAGSGSIPKWKVIGFKPAAPGKLLISYRFGNPNKGKTIASGAFGPNNTIRDWERFLVQPTNGNKVKLRIDNFGDKNYFLKVRNGRLTVVKGFGGGSEFEWIPRGGKKFALKIPGQNRYVQAPHHIAKPELKIVTPPNGINAWETFEYVLAPGFN